MYKVKKFYSFITLLLLSTLAFGQVPNTFSSGETISSSKINANFSFLADAMGNKNITAMMHFGGEVGVVDMDNLDNEVGDIYNDPQVAYSNCMSTDNASFIGTSNLCLFPYYRYDSGVGDFFCSSYQGLKTNKRNLISSKTLLDENWILSQSIFMQEGWFVNVF